MVDGLTHLVVECSRVIPCRVEVQLSALFFDRILELLQLFVCNRPVILVSLLLVQAAEVFAEFFLF